MEGTLIRLGKKYTFTSAHRLYSPALSEARNKEIYGKCANPFGHGHDYDVEVTVEGETDRVTGRVVDLRILDALLEAEVLSRYRYKSLNSEMATVQTTENLALEVQERLKAAWTVAFGASGPRLQRIRIWETDRNICEIAEKNYADE